MKLEEFIEKSCENPKFKFCWDLRKNNDTSIIIGKDENDNLEIKDLKDIKNILIGGTSGSGKSIFLHSVLTQLLVRNTSKKLKVILIDPKGVEFSKYKNDEHLKFPILTDNKDEIIKGLKDVLNIINERVEKKLKKYQELVIFIDEYSELIYLDEKINQLVLEILKQGSDVGVHLFIATQCIEKSVFSDELKNLISCRIAFLTESKEESKLLIGVEDATSLKGKGDMLFKESNESSIKHLQGYFNDEEIEKILK